MEHTREILIDKQKIVDHIMANHPMHQPFTRLQISREINNFHNALQLMHELAEEGFLEKENYGSRKIR